tara:strand:+ start:67 stop:459 length:393 start_codon:yes stop_codon:yes gene_type:complete
MNYFEFKEFDCPCEDCQRAESTGRANMQPRFLEMLDHARAISKGTSFKINSGYRCEPHNAKVKGRPKTESSKGSSHIYGWAADLACNSSQERHNILTALRETNFNRIGISGTFIHVDGDPDKSPNVTWTY